jgi:hypothetical protein
MGKKPVWPVDFHCAHCGAPESAIVCIPGSEIYSSRPDQAETKIWRCTGCGAYCGSHPGTAVPLGYPAGPLCRKLRRELHAIMDPLWRDGSKSKMKERRNAVYARLARTLGLDRRHAHVGMLDASQCQLAKLDFATATIADLVRAARDEEGGLAALVDEEDAA